MGVDEASGRPVAHGPARTAGSPRGQCRRGTCRSRSPRSLFGVLGSIPLLVAPACGDDPSAMDREVLLDLADDVGDAVGATLSASWTFSPTSVSCTCRREDIASLDDIGVCTLISSPLVGVSRLAIVQADGFASVRAGDLQLTGAVQADSSLIVAAVASYRLLDTRSLVLVRWDATASEDTSRLEGTWSQRGVLDLGAEGADCTATYSIVAERL